jgi:hypothetical protein
VHSVFAHVCCFFLPLHVTTFWMIELMPLRARRDAYHHELCQATGRRRWWQRGRSWRTRGRALRTTVATHRVLHRRSQSPSEEGGRPARTPGAEVPGSHLESRVSEPRRPSDAGGRVAQ